MSNKKVDPQAAANDGSFKSTQSRSRFSIMKRASIQWFVRLMPAISFGLYAYSHRGPFQPPLCTSLGIGCPQTPYHLEGLIKRPEYYGQVINFYSQLMANSVDLGGSFAVFVEGQPVIDVYAGAKDLARTQVYDNMTLQQVYSSGKAIEAIMIARLVQKGYLKYEDKITKYWPEFGQNNKENVTLGDLMVYDSGVPRLYDEANEITWASLQDEKGFSDRLAREPHEFKGENKRAYHAMTRGWYLNEIVKRVDPSGRTIGQIVQQELMFDYNDIELYYGSLPKESDWKERLSPMYDYPTLRILARLIIPWSLQISKVFGNPKTLPLHPITNKMLYGESLTRQVLTPSFAPHVSDYRTREAHIVESTSFSLKTNAHSLAKLMSMMANKGHSIKPGQEPDLLSEEVYRQATTLHSTKPDEITNEVVTMSVGGWIKTKDLNGTSNLKDIEVQGWAGAGGSLTIWIEELQIGFSYVTNALNAFETLFGDFRGHGLLDRVVYARQIELGLLPKVN